MSHYTQGKRFENVAYSLATKIKPRTFLPISGTNEENFKTAHTLLRAGGKADILPFDGRIDRLELITAVAEKIAGAHLVVFADEFCADERAKEILKADLVYAELQKLVSCRDGLIFGEGRGVFLLQELGFLPRGSAQNALDGLGGVVGSGLGGAQAAQEEKKESGRVIVSSNLSPWLTDCKVGEGYEVCHLRGRNAFFGDGRLVEEWSQKGRIALTDERGEINGLTSADGRVLGKLSLPTENPAARDLTSKLFEAGLRYYM